MVRVIYVSAIEARENELIMQHIADRFDSKRGFKKAIKGRKPWFTGPIEDTDQNSKPVARREDFSNRLTIVNKMATDKVNEPIIVIEIEQTGAEDNSSSGEREKKSKVENKEFDVETCSDHK